MKRKPSKSDLEFNLSRSLKVNSDGAVGLLINGFLLVFKGNIYPNWADWGV